MVLVQYLMKSATKSYCGGDVLTQEIYNQVILCFWYYISQNLKIWDIVILISHEICNYFIVSYPMRCKSMKYLINQTIQSRNSTWVQLRYHIIGKNLCLVSSEMDPPYGVHATIYGSFTNVCSYICLLKLCWSCEEPLHIFEKISSKREELQTKSTSKTV